MSAPKTAGELDDELEAHLFSSPSPNPSITSPDDLDTLPPFPLLDLPNELVSLLCRFVACLKFDYAESRRPRPSPLAILGASSKRLHELTAPLLWRNLRGVISYKDQAERPLSLDDARVRAELCRNIEFTFKGFTAGCLLELEDFDLDRERYRGVESVELVRPAPLSDIFTYRINAQTLLSPLLSFPFLTRLKIRLSNSRSIALETPLPPLPHLVSLSLRGCHTSWLKAFSALPTLKGLKVALGPDQPLVDWTTAALWHHLESFEIEVPPPLGRSSPIADAMKGIALPPNPSLRALAINVRLQLAHQATPVPFSSFVPSLRVFFNLPHLRSLTLDEYTTVDPAAVADLARSFPLLTDLAFKDRTVWTGFRAEHLEALSNFKHLSRLEY
ncbi:hypothetical protein RQP46_002253 [Phenoliferia psychrophenolica]